MQPTGPISLIVDNKTDWFYEIKLFNETYLKESYNMNKFNKL